MYVHVVRGKLVGSFFIGVRVVEIKWRPLSIPLIVIQVWR